MLSLILIICLLPIAFIIYLMLLARHFETAFLVVFWILLYSFTLKEFLFEPYKCVLERQVNKEKPVCYFLERK